MAGPQTVGPYCWHNSLGSLPPGHNWLVTKNPPPLDGVRVLDFSRIIAGPLCTQQLADLGAEVIKVENPTHGDDMRARSRRGDRRGAAFLAFNRSKQSICIDLGDKGGQNLARQLAAEADVVIENFRPGVMDRFGLGHQTLRADHQSLIYVSISAYGSSGPFSKRPGLDPIFQAESGMMSLAGPIDGDPSRHPLSIIDTLTAAHATSAVCAALMGRSVHGKGDFIDLCLLDTAIGALGNVGLQYLTTGTVPARSGNRHVVAAPIDLFATATEPLYIAVSNDRLFSDLCHALGQPDLARDERFATPGQRSRNRDQLKEMIESALTQKPAAYWLEQMNHLPVGAVRTVDEALNSPEVIEREMVRHIPDDQGDISVLGTSFKFTNSDLPPFAPPPLLGQHTDQVLSSVLSLTPGQISELRAQGTVA